MSPYGAQVAEAHAQRQDKAERARAAREHELAAERDELELQVQGLRASAARMQARRSLLSSPSL